MNDTIYALASAAGRAGVAVYRISGPAAGPALTALTGSALPEARKAVRIAVTDPDTEEQIDDGLAIWFPGPDSYTGEDIVELHLHGGAAIRQCALEVLGRQPGLRLALPGEFTRRAVHAGKMDLTAAEGLMDLIDAETDAQRRQALHQSQGALGRIYESWHDRLLPGLAHLEAAIDFPDEDLPPDVESTVWSPIASLADEIENHLKDRRRGERLRDGLKVAILGPPNVGKSSLLNWLSQRDAAIVSAGAGTTRDVIEVHLDLEGYPVVLADTAGIREAGSEVEALGVARAFDRAQTSDLKVVVVAADDLPGLAAVSEIIDAETIIAVNKADVSEVDIGAVMQHINPLRPAVFAVSVKMETGLAELLAGLVSAVAARIGIGDSPVITRHRHREALQECLEALRGAVGENSVELSAEDLRVAVRALGKITGAVDVEDLLDIIFQDFCIGK